MDATTLITGLLHEPRNQYGSHVILGLIHECTLGVTDTVALDKKFRIASDRWIVQYDTIRAGYHYNNLFCGTMQLRHLDSGWVKVVDRRDIEPEAHLSEPLPMNIRNPRPTPEDELLAAF